MKNKNSIQDKYRWNLKHLCGSDDEAISALDKAMAYADKLVDFKGKLGDPEMLYKYLQLQQTIESTMGDAGLYIQLLAFEDVANPKYNAMLDKLRLFGKKINLNTSFADEELLGLGDKYLRGLIDNPKFVDYKLTFAELMRSRKHVLDDKSNKIMAKVDQFAEGYSDVFDMFDAVDIRFDDVIDNKGRKHKLYTSNFGNFMESNDRVLRRNAWESYYKPFVAMSNTIGTNYISHVKADCAYADIYNYSSVLESELDGDNIDVSVYDKLIEQVNNHLPLLHKYYKLKKRYLGLKDYTYYDTRVHMGKSNGKYPYDKCVDIAYQALKPMGDKYVNLVHEEVSNRWVDVYPYAGKTTGGFEIACYGKHPYIMLF